MKKQIGYARLQNDMKRDISRAIKTFEKKADATVKRYEVTITIQRQGEGLSAIRFTYEQTTF
jgi:hypothetical protein